MPESEGNAGKAGTATAAPKADAPTGSNQSNLPESQRPPGDLRRRTRKDKRKGPFVKFVGSAAIRRIAAPDFRSITGPVDKEFERDFQWDVGNDKMIEAEKFSDEQLDYLLMDDMQQGTGTHAFLLVDYDPEDKSDNPQLVQVAYE